MVGYSGTVRAGYLLPISVGRRVVYPPRFMTRVYLRPPLTMADITPPQQITSHHTHLPSSCCTTTSPRPEAVEQGPCRVAIIELRFLLQEVKFITTTTHTSNILFVVV